MNCTHMVQDVKQQQQALEDIVMKIWVLLMVDYFD